MGNSIEIALAPIEKIDFFEFFFTVFLIIDGIVHFLFDGSYGLNTLQKAAKKKSLPEHGIF